MATFDVLSSGVQESTRTGSVPAQGVQFTPPDGHNSENALKGCDVVPRHGNQRGNDHAKAAAEHLNNKQAREHGAGDGEGGGGG